MSSIVERLTEGVVNRDMRAESHALLTKWKKTGLLEGLDGERERQTMCRLLENQAKELLREQSTLAAGDVQGFAAVAFPIVRRVFAGLIANDLVSVQPMSLPSGLIFFLDFTFSDNLGTGTQTGRLGNTAGDSIYGTDKVGAGIIDGVDLLGASKQDLSGPRTAATRGYAYSSPSGSNNAALTDSVAGTRVKGAFVLDGAVTEANKKLIEYDADLLSVTDSSLGVVLIDIEEEEIEDKVSEGDPDFDNLAPFLLDATAAENYADALGSTATQIRRLTRLVSASEAATTKKAVRFAFVAATVTAGSTATTTAIPQNKLTFPVKDQIDAVSGVAGAVVGDLFELEANAEIPEIDIKVDSTAITAQTKKLKAKWTPELGQDLNAYHNLDAEVELTSILSEQIALEIDREILADLVNGATAATRYWSRAPGLFVDVNGNELGASSAAPDFTGTVSEWYETLVETINDVSAQIHRKTLRGGANFLVCGPEVANILEFTAGFRASVTHDDEKGSVGAVRVGSLSKKFDVIVDPYFLRNVILVGRRGASFLESGYVYAPYVPLQTTPTIFGPEDFVPRKGVMTRYAKKMVRPDMYGLVIVRGLLGESGLS
jgi:hypothetical protein